MNVPTQRTPALIFDFGNVLVDWDPRYLYRKILNGDEQAVEKFLQDVDFFEWNRQQDAGRPFTSAINELCGKHPQYCELIRAYDNRYEESISGPIWQTVSILNELRSAGYPFYGLSNWPAEKFPPVRDKYEFFRWFDDIIISGEVKLAKPDPAIFELTLKRIGRHAEECLLIDNSIHNIEAAQDLGFQTILFRSPEALRLELVSLGVLDTENPPVSSH